MSIIQLKPAYKNYFWGGTSLITHFFKEYDGKVLAESWELSCHKDGESIVSNGVYAGLPLSDWLRINGMETLGSNCKNLEDFPILIKFIDAAQNLSIQVHPDDLYARRNEGQRGKTEAWYIVDCVNDAFVYLGFQKSISKEEFAERIKNQTIVEVLSKKMVRKGDILFIAPGTVHAIGAGILALEIQQSSNVTYRVYDFGRKDLNGRTRELHIEKACEVADLQPYRPNYDFHGHLLDCPYFTADLLLIRGSFFNVVFSDTFHSLIVLEGEGVITCGDETRTIRKGDSIFLPAESGEYRIKGCCEVILTTIRNEM